MEEITIKDALKAKRQMELDISILLTNFTANYKLKVNSIGLDMEELNRLSLNDIGDDSIYTYSATIEVKL